MHGVTFRHATASDGVVVHGLIHELAETLGLPQKLKSSPNDFSAELGQPTPAFRAVIAEHDGKAVGLCLYFTSFSSWRGAKGVYVQDLYVADAMRHTGLGKRLLQYVAARAGSDGAQYLRLAVDADNVSAQSFYERIGMHWVEEDRVYVIDGPPFVTLSTEGKDTL